MRIEVWSDIACPFCYLGLAKLNQAIQNLGLESEVQIELHTFLLNPGLKTDLSESITNYLQKHRQIPLDRITEMNQQIALQGNQFGLEFQMDKIVVANTIKAHLLLRQSILPIRSDTSTFLLNLPPARKGSAKFAAYGGALDEIQYEAPPIPDLFTPPPQGVGAIPAFGTRQ